MKKRTDIQITHRTFTRGKINNLAIDSTSSSVGKELLVNLGSLPITVEIAFEIPDILLYWLNEDMTVFNSDPILSLNG